MKYQIIPGPELEAEVGEVSEHDRGAVAEYVEARPNIAAFKDLPAVPRDGAEVGDQKRRVATLRHLASDVQELELFLAVGGGGFGVVLDNLHVQSVVRSVLVRER